MNLSEPGYKIERTLELAHPYDLILSDSLSRNQYAIECKWGNEQIDWLKKLNEKDCPKTAPHWNTFKAIVCGYPVSKAFMKKAKEYKIIMIQLEDLVS